MLIAPLISAGLEVLRQKGVLDELAIQREIRVGQVRRYWFRSEVTSGLDEFSMEYDVVVKTILKDRVPKFVFSVANIRSSAGSQRFTKPGVSMNLVSDAIRTGWIAIPSFAEGLGAIGLPLSALLLPRIGKTKASANQPLTSLDGILINGFSLGKDNSWPEITMKIPVTRGNETGSLWLRLRYQTDGWPQWCDGNWQFGDATLVYRLERR